MKPPNQRTNPAAAQAAGGERIAKVLARVGLCSRRDAERWIAEGRVAVNGTTLTTPAFNVGPDDRVIVDGKPLPRRERTRLWLYHKPKGLVTTARDPEGRPTVFDALPDHLPRVVAIGRLDINTEGLLLLTNDGGLARVLELPSTGWLRRYRARAWGEVTQPDLDRLKDGLSVDGVLYGAIDAALERVQGTNVWITLGLREGKNREVKNVLSSLGLDVNRLIRVSYGPFQLGDLAEGEVVEIRGRVLRDQLGEKLARESGADFDAPVRETAPQAKPPPAKSSPAKPLAKSSPAKSSPAKPKTPRAASAPPARGDAPSRPARREDSGGPQKPMRARRKNELPKAAPTDERPARGPGRGPGAGRKPQDGAGGGDRPKRGTPGGSRANRRR